MLIQILHSKISVSPSSTLTPPTTVSSPTLSKPSPHALKKKPTAPFPGPPSTEEFTADQREALPSCYPIEAVSKLQNEIERDRRLDRTISVQYLIRRACSVFCLRDSPFCIALVVSSFPLRYPSRSSVKNSDFWFPLSIFSFVFEQPHHSK